MFDVANEELLISHAIQELEIATINMLFPVTSWSYDRLIASI